MINEIIKKLRNKNIAILGFGREGRSTYEFIRKYVGNQNLTIIDKNEINDDLDNVDLVYGEDYLDGLEQYDLVIKTPGISLKDIDTSNIKITSQMELVLEVAKKQVIGVTGTKGKSTTASLIYSILKEHGKDAVLAGNIGIPVLSQINELHEDTFIVLEMSSHQLEYLNVSPHIGIVLNLFEDHLDHAGSVRHYHDIKMNMFKYQTADDYMIYCEDNDTLSKLVNCCDFKAHKYTVSLVSDNESIYLKDGAIYYQKKEVFKKDLKRELLGIHNLENIMVAFLVSKILNLDDDITLRAISKFKPLEYRLELIGVIDDVKYYVDTLATIPKATIEAIEAIPDIDTLIFGGMDRGISYEGFAEYLTNTNITHFICMPTTGHVIGQKLPKDKTYFVDTLEEACKLAMEVTQKGKSCILSPAAASYEQFKNYAEKGDKYKEYILDK